RCLYIVLACGTDRAALDRPEEPVAIAEREAAVRDALVERVGVDVDELDGDRLRRYVARAVCSCIIRCRNRGARRVDPFTVGASDADPRRAVYVGTENRLHGGHSVRLDGVHENDVANEWHRDASRL